MSLTPREKQQLARLAAKEGQRVLTAIPAAIYLSSPNPKIKRISVDSLLKFFPNLTKDEWTYTNITGFLAFVVNSAESTYFFEVYDVETFEVRFKQELYYDVKYKELSESFHCFEIEDCICGFNFANATEAQAFHSKVSSLTPTRKKKGRKGLARAGSFFQRNDSTRQTKGGSSWFLASKAAAVAISEPYNLTQEDLTPEWKRILENAGIKKKDLRKPGVQEMIQEILEEANISAQEPPKMSAAEAKQHYNDNEIRQYERYQQEKDEYNRRMVDFEREQQAYLDYLKELEQLKEQEANLKRHDNALNKWEADNAKTLDVHRKIKDAVGLNKHGKKPPPLPPRGARIEDQVSDIQSAVQSLQKPPVPTRPALPKLPALPTIARPKVEEKKEKLKRTPPPLPTREERIKEEFTIKPTTINRKGKVRAPPPLPVREAKAESVISGIPSFMQPTRNPFQPATMQARKAPPKQKMERQPSAQDLINDQIKNGPALRHLSRLPDLKSVREDVKNTLLRRLKEKLEARRGVLEESDSESEDDDDISDWQN